MSAFSKPLSTFTTILQKLLSNSRIRVEFLKTSVEDFLKEAMVPDKDFCCRFLLTHRCSWSALAPGRDRPQFPLPQKEQPLVPPLVVCVTQASLAKLGNDPPSRVSKVSAKNETVEDIRDR